MKKILAIMLVSIAAFSFTACGSTTQTTTPQPAASEAAVETTYTAENAMAGYWGMSDYVRILEDGSLEKIKNLADKKDLQESAEFEVYLISSSEDGNTQFGFKGDSAKGTWVLDEANTTEDKWCYEISLDNATNWSAFILAEDTETMYLPVQEDVAIVFTRSNK